MLPGMLPIARSERRTDTGWVIAGAGSAVSTGGGRSWGGTGNIIASDDSRATVNGGHTFSESNDLKASSFGLSIPDGATVEGVAVRYELSKGNGLDCNLSYANIGKDDSTLGTAKTDNDVILTGDGNFDKGGRGDMWGLSLTPSDVNASTFQVRLRVGASPATQIFGRCDAIWVKVFYKT